MSGLEVLRAARDRISSPERWCVGFSAVDAQGNGVDPRNPNARRWCSIGAIGAVSRAPGHDEHAYIALSEAMGGEFVGDWNDAHTHVQVLAAFDRAIAKLNAPGGRRR